MTEADLEKGRVYPPIPTIHDVTVKIAAHLAEHLYKQKKAWCYPGQSLVFHKTIDILSSCFFLSVEPQDKEAFIRMQLYDTSYQYYGPATWKWPDTHNQPRDIPQMDENIALDA